MRFRPGFIVGFTAGFYIGSMAGREWFSRINSAVGDLLSNDRAEKLKAVGELATERAKATISKTEINLNNHSER